MATDKQIAANRNNARKSTGPRTAAGKSQSAQNARKHGFAASTFTVSQLEAPDEVSHLRQDALDLYRPLNSQELYAVERVALCQSSLLRVARLEASLFSQCMVEGAASADPNVALAAGFQQATRKPHTWALFLRYQAQAERQYRRAIEELNRLRTQRAEFEEEELEAEMDSPNEANFPLQSQSNQSDPHSEPNRKYAGVGHALACPATPKPQFAHTAKQQLALAQVPAAHAIAASQGR